MLSGALKKIGAAVRDNNQPTVVPGFLRPIETERIAKELDLDVVAAERGRKDVPDSSEKSPDSVEHAIVQRIESEWAWQGAELINNLRAYASRLTGYSIPAEFEKLKLLAENALTRLRSVSVRAPAELGPLQDSYIAARNELEAFRKRHKLLRPARHPTKRRTTIGLMFGLIVIESAFNGVFFAKGSELGLLGGVVTAVAISFMNVILAFGIGLGPARLMNRRGIFLRLVGFVGVVGGTAIVTGLHAFAVHYRDATALVGEDRAFAAAIESLLQNPWRVSDLSSIYLFGLGMIFAIFAYWKGYFFDDPYPQYGATDRRQIVARENYSEEHRILFDDLEEIKEDTIQQLRDGIDKIPLFPQLAANIRNERAAMVQQFRAYETSITTAANQLLKHYRDINRNWRKSSPPIYFNSDWALKQSFLDSSETRILLANDGSPESVDLNACLSELRRLSETVLSEYGTLITRYPHPTEMK